VRSVLELSLARGCHWANTDIATTHRLQDIYDKTRGKVQVVMHGTNEFTPNIMAKCIERGVTRINANRLVLEDYNNYIAQNTGKVPLTQLIEEGTAKIQKLMEWWMDKIKSSGKI
jgi:fructose-bisphosphate aldolase class II